jgi:hypothetical protein
MNDTYKRMIPSNAPARLKGKEMVAVLTDDRLEFQMDMPDNPTAQEVGFFKWFVGECMDELKSHLSPEAAEAIEGPFITGDEKHAT